MTRDADAKNARLFDRRTVERNIKKGLVTRKDYEKHLKALADIADKGTHGGDDPADDLDEPDERDEPEAGDAGTNSHN
ncbi:MAG TPA: hypothetical protein VH374_03640 [Polyangia bacterium]|jgi:hypothetical protein|nr:hypothetical protein [Polyangia bacterium]